MKGISRILVGFLKEMIRGRVYGKYWERMEEIKYENDKNL